MIIGSHLLLSSQDRAADRGFFRDGLGVRSLGVGEGWLILATPPAEGGIHPLDGECSQRPVGHQQMGDDLESQIEFLNGRNVHCTGMRSAPWGRVTTIPSSSGGHIGLYEPLRTTAFHLNSTLN